MVKLESVLRRPASCRHGDRRGAEEEGGVRQTVGEGEWEELGGRRDRAGLLQTSLEVGGADVAASQRAVDVLLEEPPVRLQNLRCLLVQRVLRVRLLGVRGHMISWGQEH